MEFKIKTIALALSLFFVLSCAKKEHDDKVTTTPIAVSWKLINNFAGPGDTFEARFRIDNKGDIALTDKNWSLYFSMSPRAIHENKTPQPAIIKHLNGDWYQMTPESGFSLAPGESIDIHYRGTEGIIKHTDAPMGLYFVFYDKDGNEEGIAQVENLKIEDFSTKEQLLRGEEDRLDSHSPERIYRKNEGLSVVAEEQIRKIIPSPVTFKPGTEEFVLESGQTISYGEGLEKEADFFRKKLEEITGVSLKAEKNAPSAAISLVVGKVEVNGTSKEAYQLLVNQTGIQITGNDQAGVFYGIQSLIAMIPLDNWQSKGSVKLAGVSIEDAPRFGFRSVHLDVSRNFQTKETVLRILDLLAFYKINHLLLYVTEDEGWRVEIKGLPELTEVGGQRGHVAGIKAAALHPSYGSGPVPNEKGKHGSGYYTRNDFIEILKYAAERHITVIPELNFPGHARAAIKAMEARYEKLMNEGKKDEAEEYRLADPDDQSEYLSAQFYKDNVVSVARESTYKFYEKVVDEYVQMYKEAGLTLKKFHIGGDEVAEGAWTKSPQAQKLLSENPSIRDPKNLHIYFLRKLLPILQKKGLEVHGWEEVALEKNEAGVYVPNPEFAGKGVVPYIWNNLYDLDLGNKLANAGYPVVLCNVTNFYFDLAYNNDPQEPGLYWGGFVDARTNWEFAPFDYFKTTFTNSMGAPLDFSKAEKLKPEARKNVIGIEAQLWAETIKGREMVEYYMLPKLMGFAESAWGPERKWETIDNARQRKAVVESEWNVFANRLARVDLPRLAYLNNGYNYRIPAPGAVVESGVLKANTELPGLTIRYTTDGSEPTASSAVYEKPLPSTTGQIKLKAFDSAGRASKTIEIKN